MKKLLMILSMVMLAACAGKDGSNGSNGANGRDGNPGIGAPGNGGSNGHSIVAHSRAASNIECPFTAGTAVDFYTDLDDSMSFTSGDLLQAGVVSCNGMNGQAGQNGQDGSNGQDGATGPQGNQGDTGPQGAPGAPGTSATMTAYSLATASQCVQVHSTVWARRESTTQVALYTGNLCALETRIDVGPNQEAMSSTLNEVFVQNNLVFILEGSGANTVIKKLVY